MAKRMMQMKMYLNQKKPTEADLELYDDIGEETDIWTGKTKGISAHSINEFLSEHKDVDTINVHINSNGGLVFEGIAIYNILKSSDKQVNVIIDGIGASIASVIAMSGDSVKMYPTSQLMIHNCWTIACGNANDFRKLADQMDGIMESSKIAYLEKANETLTIEKLEELLEAETYLSAQECFDYGLCDEIIGVCVREDEEDDSDEEEPIKEPSNDKKSQAEDETDKDDEETKEEPKKEAIEPIVDFMPMDKSHGWFLH